MADDTVRMGEIDIPVAAFDMLVDALSDVDAELQGDITDTQLAAMTKKMVEHIKGPGGLTGTSFTTDELDEGRVYVYSTLNGERSEIPFKLLRATLKKRLQNVSDMPPDMVGRPAFSVRPVDPAPYPRHNLKLKCHLHPESDERAFMDSIGLGGAFCRKANLATPLDQYLHLKNKHRNAAAMYDRETQRAREDAAEKRQEALFDRLVAVMERQAGVQAEGQQVADAPKAKAAKTAVAKEQ